MDFETAWSAAALGAEITVSDGEPQPSEDNPRRLALWRRRNCTGTVVEKTDDLLVISVESEAGTLPYPFGAADGCDYAFPSPDLASAEVIARAKIEDNATRVCAEKFKLARQVLVMQLWGEVQMLKIIPDFNTLTAAERARRVPFLAALAQRKGVSIATVQAAVESRLEARVWSMAQASAKLIDGHDQVAAATTPEEKIAAADAINWAE